MLDIILYMFYSCCVLAIVTVIIFIIFDCIKKAKTKTWQICCFLVWLLEVSFLSFYFPLFVVILLCFRPTIAIALQWP